MTLKNANNLIEHKYIYLEHLRYRKPHLIPGSPLFPVGPKGPSSPFSPGSPFVPGSPVAPGVPVWPGSPTDPGSPAYEFREHVIDTLRFHGTVNYSTNNLEEGFLNYMR